MASATRDPSERSTTPPHLRQGHRRTARSATSSHTPFAWYGEVLAWDSGREAMIEPVVVVALCQALYKQMQCQAAG
jgi:hypothetical protein